jgi:type IV pilus assembly protein PilA
MFRHAMGFFSKVLKKEKGFTLVELLATLVIIGIIAAIAVPAIGNVIENSEDKAKVADALMIIDAAKLARAENPDQTSWKSNSTSNALSDYLDKVKDDSWTVKYNATDKEYSIVNHEVSGTEITEQALVNKTK